MPARDQRVANANAETAGEMVVAHARRSDFCVLRRFCAMARRRIAGERHDRLQRASDLRGRQPIVAMAPLFRHREKIGGEQFGEMRTGCLRRHLGCEAQLQRRQRAAVHEGCENIRPRDLAYEACDLSHFERVPRHVALLSVGFCFAIDHEGGCQPRRKRDKCFDHGRSELARPSPALRVMQGRVRRGAEEFARLPGFKNSI
jgi:hypothetical protein